MECPDEQTIAGFVRGELREDAVKNLEQHLDTCSACASVIAAFVQLFEAEGERFEPPPVSITEPADVEASSSLLKPGAAVGRYKVLEIVGIGGMGVVYAAYDPELDRKLALKLLRRTERRAAERRLRLVREAQAMAKLAHPNVITIHDVGALGDQVFLAMEFIEGQTLRKWLDADPPWSEVLQVFIAAGRGLQAAHERGIIHRDFKPENVLIGDDGRVLVTDFGLARFGAAEATPSVEQLSTLEDKQADSLTRAGALLGTPAYMAPERFDGGEVTFATDQYSFCVALYEAAYGERPYHAKSLAELATRVAEGRPDKPKSECRAPARVREAFMRGLAVEPRDRFPTMEALLAELRRRPPAWRRLVLVALPLTALAIGVAAYTDGEPPPTCTRDSLDEIWNAGKKEELAQAFHGSELAYADESWTRVEAGLDGYAGGWLDLDERACSDRIDDPADPRSALRALCLVPSSEALEVAIALLSEADESVVENAQEIVARLPSYDHCADDEALVADRLDPVPSALTERVAAARKEVAAVYASIAAGRYEEAVAMAEQVVADSADIDYEPLQAEVAYIHAGALGLSTRYDEADAQYHRAATLATAARHHEIAAKAWLRLASAPTDSDRYDQALRFIAIAQAEIEAWGQDRGLLGQVHKEIGDVQFRAGNFADALAAYGRAEPMYADAGRELRRAEILVKMGECEVELRHLEEGLAHFEEAIAVQREALGEEHPDLANTYRGLSFVYLSRGDLPGARKVLETAEALLRKAVGTEHPQYVSIIGQLGQILSFMGEHERAIEMLEHALKVELADGPIKDMRQAIAVATVAQTYFNADRFEDAAREARRAVEALERIYPEGNVREVVPRMNLGMALLYTGDPDGALEQADKALAACTGCPAHDPNRLGAVELKGRVLMQQGRRKEAVAVLAEGYEASRKLGGVWEGWFGFRWAEAVWPERDQRARALELARRGQQLLRESGDARLSSIDAWLEKHG